MTAIIYSLLSPLILPIATMAFMIFWFFHRYLLIYVLRSPADTAARASYEAILQLFTGLYVLELCFIGLFLLKAAGLKWLHGLGQTIVVIILLICTTLHHLHLVERYHRLFRRKALEVAHPDLLFSTTPKQTKVISRIAGSIDDPILFQPVPVVWIPEDTVGFSRAELRSIRLAFSDDVLPASKEGAQMDAKGEIQLDYNVRGAPEDWLS